MTRRRLGVALVVPEPVATEVNGLRRALGDPALERIAPHITLVPPVNVREDEFDGVLARIRAAAAAAPPQLQLTLGPPASFLPANPVLMLTVGGDLAGLAGLRHRVFVEPLARPLTWPFVAHVTVADGIDPGRIEAAMTALDHYSALVAIDRIHLLEEQRDPPVGRHGQRRWVPIADTAFGRPSVVGRGGLDLELTRSQLVDPRVAELLTEAPRPETGSWSGGSWPGTIVVTGRQQGRPVGAGAAWWAEGQSRIAVFVGPADRGQGFGAHLLAAVEAAVVDAGWPDGPLRAYGPARFYEVRSARSRVRS